LIRFVKFTAFSILASNMRQLQGSCSKGQAGARRLAAAVIRLPPIIGADSAVFRQ